ncbi:MAG TPA: hypothetical protein DDW76_00695 [Cyanobacteria bacterium UBA11369]|nr:hypothetical protein [Cyanobacteria bacterium UBA11368]HBE47354.1 hypothetical protein [Cyanobacteria bacterium UBA11369]
MIINDLSYLEVVEENRVVGGDFDFYTELDFDSDVEIYKEVRIDVYISSNVNISGNVAIAEASANAIGENTFTEVYVSTYTDGYSSHSSASAKSVTSD